MRRPAFRILALLLLGTFAAAQNGPSPAQLELHLPLEKNSVRFAVIGDSGTGDREQYDIAEEMAKYREKVNFDFVIMLGDNIYGGHNAKDLQKKFETPYKILLDAGVKFYASLGNHDDPGTEIAYKPFNMNGERYYFFKKGDVAFYALDSNYMDPIQLSWLQENLQKSDAKWKIPYFHHPLYNNGRIHGADVDLRSRLEPLFKQYGVNIVFSGHEHAYERFRPQNGIYYFVLGSSAKLIDHDFRSMENLEKAFDADRTFAIVEISGDKLYYQTIARRWQTIDYGVVQRQPSPGTKSASAR